MPYIVLLLPFFLLLASCASTSVSTTQLEGSPGGLPSVSEVTESDVMYQVLLGELAGKTGDLQTATRAYVDVARISDDPAVAERATRIALFGRVRLQQFHFRHADLLALGLVLIIKFPEFVGVNTFQVHILLDNGSFFIWML